MKVVVDFTNKQVKGSSPKIEEKATLQGGFSKVISMFRYVINNIATLPETINNDYAPTCLLNKKKLIRKIKYMNGC